MRYLYNYDKQKELNRLYDFTSDANNLPSSPGYINKLELLEPIIEELDNVYTQANLINSPKLDYYMDRLLSLAFLDDNLKFDKVDKKFSDIATNPRFVSIKKSLSKIFDIRTSLFINKDFRKHFIIYSHGNILIMEQSLCKSKMKRKVADFFEQYEQNLNEIISAKTTNPEVIVPVSTPELAELKKTLRYR